MAFQGSGHADNRRGGEGQRPANKFLTPDGGGFDKSPSLHKLPQQSSTETSGLGETLTSGFSSQESIRSTQSFTGERSTSEAIVAPANQCRSGTAPKVFSPIVTMKGASDKKPLILTDQSVSDGVRMGRSMQAPADSAANENFDKLFENPPPSQSSYRGLQVEDIDKNWDRRGSEKSHRSSKRGSFRGNEDRKFLGKNLESTWTKWSKERRASAERRLKPTEDEPPTERSTTPVKKALLESTQFVHPDLEKYHISEEDKHYIQRHRQQRYATYHVIEKSKKGTRHPHEHSGILLTEKQWTILSDFWEHRTFSRSRYVAMFFGFTTTILMIASICSNWIEYSFLAGMYSTGRLTQVTIELMDFLGGEW